MFDLSDIVEAIGWNYKAMPLSEAQVKALQVLSKKGTYQEAANLAKVNRRTVIRWAKLAEFQEQLQSLSQARSEVISEVLQKHELCSIEDLIPKAISAVQTILDNREARGSDLLKAADLVGKWAGLGQSQAQTEAVPQDSLKSYINYLALNGNGKNQPTNLN